MFTFHERRGKSMNEYKEQEIIDAALTKLAETIGIQGQVTTQPAGSSRLYDARIDFSKNGHKFSYFAECKSRIERAASIPLIKEQLAGQTYPGLLIAPYISSAMAKICKEIDLQFIDIAGNAYLHGRDIYVFVNGQRMSEEDAFFGGQKGMHNPSALKLMFALLCTPELASASYREIAKQSNIALGAVGTIVDSLIKRELIVDSSKTKIRSISDYSKLLNEWVMSYPTVLRPKLKPRRFRAPEENWWTSINVEDLGARWGGEIAAAAMTKYLKPATQTLYVNPENLNESVKHLMKTCRLRPDANGPIEILSAFWNDDSMNGKFSKNERSLVAPVLVYADLIASLDPRNIEVATIIRKGFLNELA